MSNYLKPKTDKAAEGLAVLFQCSTPRYRAQMLAGHEAEVAAMLRILKVTDVMSLLREIHKPVKEV